MFFTKVGLVIAWLLVIAGVLRAGMGFYLAGENDPALISRYLGSHTTGEAIDRGILYVLIGVSVGIVAEISRSVAAKSDAKAHTPS